MKISRISHLDTGVEEIHVDGFHEVWVDGNRIDLALNKKIAESKGAMGLWAHVKPEYMPEDVYGGLLILTRLVNKHPHFFGDPETGASVLATVAATLEDML